MSDDLKRGNVKAGQAPSCGKATEEGIRFRSYLDGTSLLLTPETSVRMQKSLGADLILPLDELLPNLVDRKKHMYSFERTHRWALRSLQVHLDDPRAQAMLGIVHGGTEPEFRQISAEFLSALPLEGFAVGGSLGKDREDVERVLRVTLPALDRAARPVHVLGIGDPPTVRSLVTLGADTCDSSFPTKLARHGTMFLTPPSWRALLSDAAMPFPTHLNLAKGVYADSSEPLDPRCACATCTAHPRAYLHHLLRMGEPSAFSLLSVHNLSYMQSMMRAAREGILEGWL